MPSPEQQWRDVADTTVVKLVIDHLAAQTLERPIWPDGLQAKPLLSRETVCHSLRVACGAVLINALIDPLGDRALAVAEAGAGHDIGKVGNPIDRCVGNVDFTEPAAKYLKRRHAYSGFEAGKHLPGASRAVALGALFTHAFARDPRDRYPNEDITQDYMLAGEISREDLSVAQQISPPVGHSDVYDALTTRPSFRACVLQRHKAHVLTPAIILEQMTLSLQPIKGATNGEIVELLGDHGALLREAADQARDAISDARRNRMLDQYVLVS